MSMEFFGVTLAGYGNYMSEIMEKDYTEPKKLPDVKEMLEIRLRQHPRLSFSEAYNKLDPIIGTGNGFAYGSQERMRLQVKKGLRKPVGPMDMYRVPATTGQDWGFWLKDELLGGAKWTRVISNYKIRSSELVRYAPAL